MSEPNAYFANLQRGLMLLQQDRPKDALPYLQAAIAANPDEPRAYAELARCFIELPAHRGKAFGAINRAIALAPNEPYYYGRKGWYLVCLMDFRGAYKAAQQGLAIDPACPQSLNALANAHTQLAQWKKAEEACRRILELDPHDGPGLNLLAQALRHLGRWKESREVVARLLANMPNNAFGHTNAGYAALAAGDHLRANEHFLESLRMDPHSDLARRGLLQSLRARIWIIRYNHRLMSYVNRPASARNLGIAFLFINGSLFSLGGIVYVLNWIHPALAICFISILVFAVLGYMYLGLALAFVGNFLLQFDPLGRHALNSQEKTVATVPAVAAAIVLLFLCLAQEWIIALTLFGLLIFLALTIQLPLWLDRRQRRHEKAADI